MEAALPWFDILWMCWEKAMGTEPDDKAPMFATITGKPSLRLRKA